MPDLQGLRGTVRGRLLLTLSGIGAGAALGALVGLAAIAIHWPGAWGWPAHEAAPLLFLVCVGGGLLLGAPSGVGLAGHPRFAGLVWLGPAGAMFAHNHGVGASLTTGAYFFVVAPALAVLLALFASLHPAVMPESDGGDTWWWRATWARIRGRPLPPLPESLRRLQEKAKEG